jgi:multiple sugar transport system substrate-binding protein
MLSQAEALARQGKPHDIEIQGASYEGYTVWINAMIASAGGRVLSENGQQVVLGPAAAKGVSLIGQLARSPAADPSLGVQMEDQNRLAFETGRAAFEVNYPFVYPSAQQNAPAIARQLGWAEYPRVDASLPSRPPVGGIDLAVSAFSRHKQQAFDAITCLRNPANQLPNAVKGGLPPTLASLYKDPRLINGGYPFAAEILDFLQRGGVRPKTPAS